jgi:hypothetical protein
MHSIATEVDGSDQGPTSYEVATRIVPLLDEMVDQMPRCGTCKHARPYDFAGGNPRFPLACRKTAEADKLDGRRGGPEHADTLALAIDMEGRYGSPGLLVSPTFGCVLHEERT